MKPLTEKVNTLSAELDLLKRSQRAAEDLMLGGLEKLEKDLREKVCVCVCVCVRRPSLRSHLHPRSSKPCIYPGWNKTPRGKRSSVLVLVGCAALCTGV
jgi:hypothetical protein